jgi:yecA family protein
MNPDDIRVALETAVGVPEAAMHAAVADPAALAPAVIAAAQRMAAGRLPLPHEEKLLRFGLFALAAARYSGACPALLALLRRPMQEVAWLFGDDRQTAIAQLLLSLFDGDEAALHNLITDTAVDADARSGLLQALARLAWEGRVSRERVLTLLDRLDDETLAPQDSWVWFGWQEAIMLLGATDRIDRVQRGWEAGRLGRSYNAADRQDWLDQTQKAADQPEDPDRFVTNHIVPIDDPAKSVDWSADPPGGRDQPLSSDELAWLDLALWRTVAAKNLCLEEADGLLTALAAGPVRVPASEYLPAILLAEGEATGFDSIEHRTLVADLLTRHHDALERDLTAGRAPQPWVYRISNDLHGVLWARGYLHGVTLRELQWEPLVRDQRLARTLVAPLVVMLPNPEQKGTSVLSQERRSLLIRALPEVVLATKAYWRGEWHPLLDAPAPRTAKTGRNELCPCGSGRKYKRCCGVAAA